MVLAVFRNNFGMKLRYKYLDIFLKQGFTFSLENYFKETQIIKHPNFALVVLLSEIKSRELRKEKKI